MAVAITARRAMASYCFSATSCATRPVKIGPQVVKNLIAPESKVAQKAVKGYYKVRIANAKHVTGNWGSEGRFGEKVIKWKKAGFKAGSTMAKMLQGTYAVIGIAFGTSDAVSERYRDGAEMLEIAAEMSLTMYDAFADSCGSFGSNGGAVFMETGTSTACECRAVCASYSECRSWTFVSEEGAFDGTIRLGSNNCILRSVFGVPERGQCENMRWCRSGAVGQCGVAGKNNGPTLETVENVETSCGCNFECADNDSCHGWHWNENSQVCTLLK